mgnify:CR=1 FL=1
MCYHFKQTKTVAEIERRFNAVFKNPERYEPQIYNAFSHPACAVITGGNSDTVQLFNWGLIPHWAKDTQIAKYTLNARIETLDKKPAFRSSLKNRCLIPATGFYEWQHLDAKGKQKQKFEMGIGADQLFAFAGLWSEHTDRETGEIRQTFTIITTAANTLMSKIHNTKKRMPIILSPDNEQVWLNGDVCILGNDALEAVPV